jgi:hypothetical protein
VAYRHALEAPRKQIDLAVALAKAHSPQAVQAQTNANQAKSASAQVLATTAQPGLTVVLVFVKVVYVGHTARLVRLADLQGDIALAQVRTSRLQAASSVVEVQASVDSSAAVAPELHAIAKHLGVRPRVGWLRRLVR